MTAQADRFREEQTAAEWRESRDEELQDWVRRSLEYLSGLYEPPWLDATGETSSEENGTMADRRVTERGFTVYDELTDTYGSTIRVQESSAATGFRVWIFADLKGDHLKPEERALFAAHGIDPEELACRLSASPHLDPAQAERVRDALDAFIREANETAQAEGLAAADLDGLSPPQPQAAAGPGAQPVRRCPG
jgi:hypothetical protein